MSGYFVLKNNGAQFSFNLKAGNHETILASGRYNTKAAAQNGITSVQKNAPHDERYKRLTAKDNSPYFTLIAANGEIIGTSEMYSSAVARDNGINSVKTNAPSAPTREGD